MLSWSSTATLSQLILASRRISERAKNGQQQECQQGQQNPHKRSLSSSVAEGNDLIRLIPPSTTTTTTNQIPEVPDIVLRSNYHHYQYENVVDSREWITASHSNRKEVMKQLRYERIQNAKEIDEQARISAVATATGFTSPAVSHHDYYSSSIGQQQQMQIQSPIHRHRHVFLVKGKRSRTELISNANRNLDKCSTIAQTQNFNPYISNANTNIIQRRQPTGRLLYNRYSAPQTENPSISDEADFHKFCTIRINFIW